MGRAHASSEERLFTPSPCLLLPVGKSFFLGGGKAPDFQVVIWNVRWLLGMPGPSPPQGGFHTDPEAPGMWLMGQAVA